MKNLAHGLSEPHMQRIAFEARMPGHGVPYRRYLVGANGPGFRDSLFPTTVHFKERMIAESLIEPRSARGNRLLPWKPAS
jgi:hypothetical protein